MSTILGTRETIHVANYFNTSPQEVSFLGLSLRCLQLSLPRLQTANLPDLSKHGRGEGLRQAPPSHRLLTSSKNKPILSRQGSQTRRQLWRLYGVKWGEKRTDKFWPLHLLLTSLFPAGNLVSIWPAVWKTRVGFPLIWWVFWHSKHKKNNTRK